MSPQLQWLGQLGGEPTSVSYISEALKRGGEAGISAFEKAREARAEKQKVGQEYNVKKARLLIDTLGKLTPDAQRELLADPTTQQTLSGVGISLPEGATLTGKADKIAKARTMVRTKTKSTMFGPMDLEATEMDTEMSLLLNDVDWKTNYPEVARDFELSYPTPIGRPMERFERKMMKREKKEFGVRPGRVAPKPTPPPKAKPTKATVAKDRFEELVRTGMSEEDAYRQLIKEGF